MTAKHSPGPWHLLPDGELFEWVEANGQRIRGTLIQACHDRCDWELLPMEYKRLIAAAPELLRLLSAMVSGPSWTGIVQEARALLARIDGDQ